jgi:hypothetical protein
MIYCCTRSMMSALNMAATVEIAPRRSVALFALLAILMVIASYVFVIALAAACVYLPYWVIKNAEHAPGQILLLLLGGVVIAGAMLWSLIPRMMRRLPNPRMPPRSATKALTWPIR